MFYSNFPEAMFPPCNPKRYNELCRLGEKRSREKSIVICGLARDIENFHFIKSYIERIGSMFKFYHVIIYENDSTNDTPQQLNAWADSCNNVKVISEKLNKVRHEQDQSLQRRIDMAFYRNSYLKYALVYKSDYVLVLDMDIKGVSYEGILNSVAWDLDVIGSNGFLYRKDKEPHKIYFDSWAYRGKGEDYTPKSNLLNFQRGESPVECDSVFGGAALYKSHVLKDTEYQSWSCDHVTLHKQIRDKGYRVWLNPSQIVLYSNHYYQY